MNSKNSNTRNNENQDLTRLGSIVITSNSEYHDSLSDDNTATIDKNNSSNDNNTFYDASQMTVLEASCPYLWDGVSKSNNKNSTTASPSTKAATVKNVRPNDNTGFDGKKFGKSPCNYNEPNNDDDESHNDLSVLSPLALKECLNDTKRRLKYLEDLLETKEKTLREKNQLILKMRQTFHKDYHKMTTLSRKNAAQEEELKQVRLKNKDLEKRFQIVRRELDEAQDNLQSLHFHHLPALSPKLKEIGLVRYDILEENHRIGDYVLGELLGEGFYGKVRFGHVEGKPQQILAIKILQKDRLTKIKDLEQLNLEISVLRHHPHPNIIQLKQTIHASENIYICMEKGSTDVHELHMELRGFQDSEVHSIMKGILKPIQYLHSRGICHLDLKPENILLMNHRNKYSSSRRGRGHGSGSRSSDHGGRPRFTHHDIRICDFGLVATANKSNNNHTSYDSRYTNNDEIRIKGYTCGTPGFFAPEMVINGEFEGREADMWSIGSILLELSAGYPYNWIDIYHCYQRDCKLFEKAMLGCLNDISHLEYFDNDRDLHNLVHGLLKLEPTKRLNANQALQHPWMKRKHKKPLSSRRSYLCSPLGI